MAKTREIYVASKHKVGFKNSYSSYELEVGEFLELEPGENKRDVREAAIDRLNKIVVEETHAFRDEHDLPDPGKRVNR